MNAQMIAEPSGKPAVWQPDPLNPGICVRFDQQLNTTDSIAAYALFYWTKGLNGTENNSPLVTNSQAAEALNAFIGAVRGGQPVPLVTSGFNLVYTLGGQPPNLQGANTVISGLGSVYGLHAAFQSGGSDLARVQATVSSINYFNTTFFGSTNAAGQVVFNNATSTGLNSILNGSIGPAGLDGVGKLGLLNGGIPGVLPVLGLVLAIKSGDPIGILGGLIGVFNPGLLTAGPLGWILAGASILKALTAKTPKAWGVANVTYGPGITNRAIQVNATGETFGTQKAKQTEQILIDALEGQVKAVNKQIQASLLATGAGSAIASIEDHQLGLIAQRLPTLTWRASDLNDIYWYENKAGNDAFWKKSA
jgi:hypothetical protein